MNGAISGYPILSDAITLYNADDFEGAARRVMLHLRNNPNESRGLGLLGKIAMRLGALGQSEHFLRRAIAAGDRSFETRKSLASVINQQSRYLDALPMVEALERESVDTSLSALRSMILERLGRTEEALELWERLAKAGFHPGNWVAYGHILRACGRVDDAIAAYRKAAEIDYEHGEAWWGLAGIKRPVLTDADIATMERGLAVAIDIRNSAPIHFALARAHHDRADHVRAFHHYSEANRQRAEAIEYRASELTDEVREVKETITADYLASLPTTEADSDVPIFIVSLPRSGSTLLEQMLGSHPDVEAIGELPYIPAILRSAMEIMTRGAPITVTQLVRTIPDEAARAMGADYMRRVAAHRKTGRRMFVDKLPHNWSNLLFIRRILPQAKFLDIRRDAMDCCFSNFSQSFSSAHGSSFTLKDIAQAYVDYVDYMTHLERVAPGMVHHIAYDQLVADPEPQLRAALDYLGLNWDPAVLDFHKLDRVVRTPSSEQVRRPLNRDGFDVWRAYEQWLTPLKETLGPLASQ